MGVGGSSGGGKTWSGNECVLKEELVTFADGLAVLYERGVKNNAKVLSENRKNEAPMYQDGGGAVRIWVLHLLSLKSLSI